MWTPPPRQSLPDRFHKAMLTSWYKRKIEATKCRSHVKTKLYMCAGESTRLGTLTLASGSAPCLFGGHGRATLSAKGIQLDYTRIKVCGRMTSLTFFWLALKSQLQESPHPEGVSSRSATGHQEKWTRGNKSTLILENFWVPPHECEEAAGA